MPNSVFRAFGFVTLVFLVAPLHSATLATPENQAAARTAFTEARGLFSSDKPAAVAQLRRATELDPDYLEAHQYYVLYANVAAIEAVPEPEQETASAKVTKELAAHYEALAAQEPDRPGYRYALGSVFLYPEPDRSRRYFEEMLQLDPHSGDALSMLALHAEIRGDLAQRDALRRQSVTVQPERADLWRSLVAALAETNVAEAVKAALEMGQRFPEPAASILSYVAGRVEDGESRRLYELILGKFPPAKTANLVGLFSLRLREKPALALTLAQERAKLQPGDTLWPQLQAYAQALVDAQAALAAKQPDAAREVLEKVKLPRYGADRRWLDLELAKAVAAGAGGPTRAYADLLVAFARQPTDEVQTALFHYGAAAGKDQTAVAADVAAKRAELAKPGLPFALENLATGKKVSLDDYRGRVVLVNFWYPLCGPCRGEFPYLQAVLEKYRARGFEILAINGHPHEEHMVLGLLRGVHLDFVPLRGDESTIAAYHVRGFPSNFLYGPDGRMYPLPTPVGNRAAQRTLELQIEALLPPTKS